MPAYTQFLHSEQQNSCAVENLPFDDIICNVRENDQFLARLTFAELRTRVCQDYELGCVDAPRTLQRLADGGLYGTPEEFLSAYIAGLRVICGRTA